MERVFSVKCVKNVPAFQRLLLFSTSSFSSSTTSTTTDCFAKYLVDSLGFSHQQALSASTRVSKYRKVYDFNFDANANSVVAFFRHYGFNDTQLRKIVSFHPRLLCSNVHNTLQPKFMFLQDQGFSVSHIHRLVASKPNILVTGIDTFILPAFHVLRQLLLSETHVVAVLGKIGPRNFRGIAKFLIPNVDLLTTYGIPIESIRRHIITHPVTFLQNSEKFKDIVIRVENKLRIPRDVPMFINGIHLLVGNSEEAVESKFQMFKSFGWTQSEIDAIMMKRANCFQSSTTTIKKKLDFFMNELRLKPAYLISNSAFLTYSLEKRLMPRHKVLVVLKEKGLLEMLPSHRYVVSMSEPCFLKRFVIPFKEVHQVYVKHTGCSLKKLTKEISVMLSTDSFAKYLVDSLGFSHQQALSSSTRLSKYRKVNDFNFNFNANANSVVAFFQCYGFDDTHIAKIVYLEPRVLCSNVDNTIRPKFKLLLDQGFSGSDLIWLLTMNPILLLISLESSFSPALQMLRQLIGCDTLVIQVLKKLYRGKISTLCNNLMPNVDLLTSCGIPIELIRKHLVQKPFAYVRNPEIFKDMVIRVEEKLGIPPNSPMFFYGIDLVFRCSQETIDSRCRVFKSFGWTQSDVETLMKKNACCFIFSDATITKKLDFLMNKIQLKPAYVTSYCSFLTCSLEKRIVPRHKVLLILKAKGLFEMLPSFSSIICMSEPCFLKRCVIPFKEVHHVYVKHTGCSLKKLTKEISVMLSTDSFANYLVHSLGFSHQLALSTSSRLYQYRTVKNFKNNPNAEFVVTFFKIYGFNDTHLTKIVSFDPRVLFSNVGKTIEPKLKFLQDQGFSRPDLIRVIVANPRLLFMSLESSISPALETLRQVMGCDAYVIAVLEKFSGHDLSCIIQNLMPNVALLSSYGISIEFIRKHLAWRPEPFLQNPEKFKGVVLKVEKNLGLSRDPRFFLHGVCTL